MRPWLPHAECDTLSPVSDEAKQQKLFTLDEANALVPQLTRLIERVQARYRLLLGDLTDRGLTPDDLEEALQVPENAPLQQHLDDITETIAIIEGFGCHFKGLDLGLVDFPSVVNDEVAYLCWQYGEDRVAFWHPLEEGFRGRQPLGPARPERRTIN
jgi:hypothetical protein